MRVPLSLHERDARRWGGGISARAAKRSRGATPPTPTPPTGVVGPPREGEVWSVLRASRPCRRTPSLPRCIRIRGLRQRVGWAKRSVPTVVSAWATDKPLPTLPRTDFVRRGLPPEGMARRKAQIGHGSRIRLPDYARNSGACSASFHMSVDVALEYGQRPRFRRECPALTSSSRRRVCAIDLTVVSQLLAGPHSGPGRSPGAARVSGLRSQTRGTPHLVPPHDAS